MSCRVIFARQIDWSRVSTAAKALGMLAMISSLDLTA